MLTKAEPDSETPAPSNAQCTDCGAENSIVCFCYRVTTRQLKEAYKRCGSLKGVEEATRAGSGCTGCKIILHSLFGEEPTDHYAREKDPEVGTSCAKPGRREMRGFIVANGDLESTVYASNGVAPQLGECDSTTKIRYALLDHRGITVLQREAVVRTNETFVFETRPEDLPRPFYGSFSLELGRSNFGAARFNIYWSNGRSTTSTHENASTGRIRVFLPIIGDARFLNGPNILYLALMNPHPRTTTFNIVLTNPRTKQEHVWKSELQPNASTWLNVNEFLFKPALERDPVGSYYLRLDTTSLDVYSAITSYFFVHNRKTDLWTGNHL